MNNMVCFHNPDEENGWLSNWYPSDFELGELRFFSMEQFMMYEKAVIFHDMDMAQKILQENDAAKIKQYGRQVAEYDETIWNGLRQIVVYRGLLAKFSQNAKLGMKLKKTEDAVLAECAVHDRIWGIGLSMHDPCRFEMKKWKGQNLLGFALMQVREQLQGMKRD